MDKPRKTLFGVKKDGLVPTDGIYVKNIAETSKGENSQLSYHIEAEEFAKELFPIFNLEKNISSETAIDLQGRFVIYIEVERDASMGTWTTYTNFPYSKINIPTEKKRHFELHRGNSFYLKFNSSLQTMLILYGEDILKYSTEENLEADHSGYKALRTFLRIDKKYAKFFQKSYVSEIEKWVLQKITQYNKDGS